MADRKAWPNFSAKKGYFFPKGNPSASNPLGMPERGFRICVGQSPCQTLQLNGSDALNPVSPKSPWSFHSHYHRPHIQGCASKALHPNTHKWSFSMSLVSFSALVSNHFNILHRKQPKHTQLPRTLLFVRVSWMSLITALKLQPWRNQRAAGLPASPSVSLPCPDAL